MSPQGERGRAAVSGSLPRGSRAGTAGENGQHLAMQRGKERDPAQCRAWRWEHGVGF